MELERVPSLGSMNTYWSKHLDHLRQDGMKLYEVNNLTISLQNFFQQYKRKLYQNNFRTVAVWLPLEYVTEDRILSVSIPVLLADPKGYLYPVFFAEPRGVVKDNNVRFPSAVLSSKVDLNIENYFLIRLSVSPANIAIDKHRFHIGELDRAEEQLGSVLSLMSSDYTVPNTGHCSECNFSTKCRL